MQGMWVGLTCWLCADSAVRPRGPDRYTMLITKKNLFRPTELVKLRRWLSVDVPPEGERKKALLAFQRARAINPHTAAGMVLYKDRDILALNKPSGLAVHGGPGLGEDLSSYLSLWQYEKEEPPHLAHRLDKDTSGVLLLTRHTSAARRIAVLFHDHKVIKKYLAITINVPEKPEGSIQIPLGVSNVATSDRHQMHRVVLRMDKIDEFSESRAGRTLPGGVQLAWTKYKVISSYGQRCSLIDAQLMTGFKHQLRVHLADGLLCPVLGDFKFAGPHFRTSVGTKRKFKSLDWVRGAVYLHAYELQVPEYRGKTLVIRAPLPEYFQKTTKMLGLKLPAQYSRR